MKAEAVEQIFWSKVDRRGPDECWPWLGNSLSKDRRGTLSVGGKTITAPRVSLTIAEGPPPEGKPFACHSCDNPPCVNPAHLWWGSSSDNLKDAGAKKRLVNARKTHCPHGHPYSGYNLQIVKGNQRRCRTCSNAYTRRRKARKRQQNGTH